MIYLNFVCLDDNSGFDIARRTTNRSTRREEDAFASVYSFEIARVKNLGRRPISLFCDMKNPALSGYLITHDVLYTAIETLNVLSPYQVYVPEH